MTAPGRSITTEGFNHVAISEQCLFIHRQQGWRWRHFTVRSRRSVDIERVFPDAAVQVDAGTDYRYRAWIDRERVAAKIADSIRSIDYSNFKNTVAERDRHDAYMKVWSAMYAYQSQEPHKRNSRKE